MRPRLPTPIAHARPIAVGEVSLWGIEDYFHQIAARVKVARTSRTAKLHPEVTSTTRTAHKFTERSGRGQVGDRNLGRAHGTRVELHPAVASPTP